MTLTTFFVILAHILISVSLTVAIRCDDEDMKVAVNRIPWWVCIILGQMWPVTLPMLAVR